jgi:dephospho-CoA kinase
MDSTRHIVPRLGLTGGIGSGKSTALAFLRELGAAVISSDEIVHGLYSRPEIVARIRERHGDKVMAGAEVDRGALARIVFSEPAELTWLEEQLHPHVRSAVEEFATAQEKAHPRPVLVVAEVPLLFETGMRGAFDYVMLITAPHGVRRRRLTAKLTDSEFSRRLAQQMPEEEKVALSDFVYVNTSDRRQLREFVGETAAHIIAAWRDALTAGGEQHR